MFTHGFTYSGHPVCCAAGLANIQIMEREDINGHVRDVGAYFEQQVHSLADLDIVGDVRGRKFMMCLENLADKQSKELFEPKVKVGNRIADNCQKRGLIVRPVGHMNVLSPPLTFSKENVDFLVKNLRESIEETTQQLKQEGIL